MKELKKHPISLQEIYKARKIVSQYLKPSSLIKYESLSNILGFEAFIKHENQNITGSFKIRGGINMMEHIKKTNAKGVVTFSTGNHGLSVATAAKLFDISAIVVVPQNSNPVKIKLIEQAGAKVVQEGENFDEASLVVSQISKTKNYYYIHPANEPHIVNGVGTEFLEILDVLPNLDAIILPLGGGSEVSSAVSVFKTINPKIEIYAVQAKLSSAAYSSWKREKITTSSNETFAGGFATGTAYEKTFDIYKNSLTDFILLSEDEILQGIALASHHTKNLVEGAGGSTIIAGLKLKEKLRGKKVVLQFSGANASPQELKKAYEMPCFISGKIG